MAAPFFPPENYYRVAVKALIFDDQDRLLLFQDHDGEWEIPGGGWDHAEDYQACIRRELEEEVGATVDHIGPFVFFYRCQAQHGQPKVALAVKVRLAADTTLTPKGDAIAGTRYVTKQEFVQLPFQKGEAPVQEHADKIWPPVEKTATKQ